MTPRRRRGRILVSLLLLLFAVGVVPLVWTSYELVSRSRQSIESDTKEWQLDKAQLISNQVAMYVAGLRSQVAAVARTLEMGVVAGGFKARVARIAKEKALGPYLENSASLVYVSVVDPTTSSGPYAGLDLLGDARLQEQLSEAFLRGQHGRAMISVPIVSESLREPVVVLEEPVRLGGKVQGVVLAVASLQPIRSITKESGSGGLFEVYVVDRRGRTVAHSDPKRPLAEDVSRVEIVSEFLKSVQEAEGAPQRRRGGISSTIPFVMPGPDGRPLRMLGTYRSVPDDSGWGVIVQVDIEKAFFTAIDLRRRSLYLVAIVTALAVVLGSLFAGEISRPVQKLGLFIGFLLYGGAWGLLFGLLAYAMRPWFAEIGYGKQGFFLAVLLGWAVAIFPLLKYPANPPGVGELETIGIRQQLFLGFIALSLIGTVVALAIERRLRRTDRLARAGVMITYAVGLAMLFLAFPSNPDPVRLPPGLVGEFRFLSLLGQLILWTAMGGMFWWLCRKVSRAAPA